MRSSTRFVSGFAFQELGLARRKAHEAAEEDLEPVVAHGTGRRHTMAVNSMLRDGEAFSYRGLLGVAIRKPCSPELIAKI